jgi:hypothetical protein
MMNLQKITNSKNFVDACALLLAESPFVKMDFSDLEEFKPLFDKPKLPNWFWYVRDPNNFEDSVYDLLFNSSMNGGYFFKKGRGIAQWAEDVSGSKALLTWIDQVREEDALPGIGSNTGKLDLLLKSLPYRQQRRQICDEFMNTGNFRIFSDLLKNSKDSSGYNFNLELVNNLVKIYPAGFGGDPFRKKAILVFLVLTGYLQAIGETVVNDLPIPSDYQIPRIFTFKKVITVSDEFVTLLNNKSLLDVQSEAVTHFRAAAVVSARVLARTLDIPDYKVDNVLFSHFRKDPDFIENSLPPMKCNSMWF